VIAKKFPVSKVHAVPRTTGKPNVRQRDLPAHVVIYYVIALALYMQSSYREVLRCPLEGVQWLLNPSVTVKVAGKSGVSQARTRLGSEPLRQLHDEVVEPIAVRATRGLGTEAGSWSVWTAARSMLPTTRPMMSPLAGQAPVVAAAPIRKSASCPWWRMARTCCSAPRWQAIAGEIALARAVLPNLRPGMLCMADRLFFGISLWKDASSTGADLLWRIKKNTRLACEER
jgi:hypothetical protein